MQTTATLAVHIRLRIRFHRQHGTFAPGTIEFLGFTVATWVVTPLFTLIYIVYATRSALRNAYDQAMFAIEGLILIGM
ncbi:hypothetical protein WM16_29830 [Burkholderia ubonensis]|uniref:Uncharacterized protein n=1 Tax=Burkholderia ubonensis TaxID=101571 RepID=A0A119V0S1_9BURK|nr:hypothetical protein WM16_29830 [Burkholderia ubonensis]